MRTFNNSKVNNYLKALRISDVKLPSNSCLRDSFNFYILMHLNIMMVHEVFDVENNVNYLTKRNELKQILQTDVISKALRKIKISDCKEKQSIPIILLKLKLYDVAAVAFILRSKQNHNRTKI